MPDALQALLADIRACRACAHELPNEPRPVVMVGAEVRVLICGQAPGRRVHESGIPFDDPSGDRLRGWLGVDRQTFYNHPALGVAAMAFCYPGTAAGGGDFPPPPRCAQLWRQRLLAAMPKVSLTLLIGSYAQVWALGKKPALSVDQRVRMGLQGFADVVCLPHPSWRNTSWLQKNPWFDEQIIPPLQRRVAEILVV